MYKICIATPVYGGSEHGKYSVAHVRALLAFARDPALHVLAHVQVDTDLVRARSRCVREVLGMPDATHLLFWDEDVVAEPSRIKRALQGMLSSGFDFVAAPYPRKTIKWDTASQAAIAGRDAEGEAVHYPMILENASSVIDRDCVEISHVGLGFALLSISMLRSMTAHYAETLGFTDLDGTRRIRTVALFQLLMAPPDGYLLSEDYSFCERWRLMGGKVWLYVGDGAPLDHEGCYRYRGKREGFVLEVK